MKKFGLAMVLVGIAVMPVFGGITYVCSTNIEVEVCSTLNNVIAPQYGLLFSNANASLYVQYGNTGSSVGQNTQFYNTVDYTSYYNALKSHQAGSADADAVNSLPVPNTTPGIPFNNANPEFLGYGVSITSALEQALGLSLGPMSGSGICSPTLPGCPSPFTGVACSYSNIGTGNCFNDIITISEAIHAAGTDSKPDNGGFYYGQGPYTSGYYDFFTTIQHETNEALGTSSCIGNNTVWLSDGCTNHGLGLSAADFYRYSAPGVRGLSLVTGLLHASPGSPYFSVNGGVTSLGPMHNLPDGADYGDFATDCLHVQDSFGCHEVPGLSMLTDGGAEIAMLDAVGYNLTATGRSLSAATYNTPEPGTIGLFTAAFGGFVLMRRRAFGRK